MLNIRAVILSAVLLIGLIFAVPLVTARTEVASNPASDPAGAPDTTVEIANQRKEPIPSYRSPLDECYDVPLREAAGCRKTSQAPIPSYRSPLDVCFDVPLSAATACRLAEQADAP